jgi:putative sterol carrier protein
LGRILLLMRLFTRFANRSKEALQVLEGEEFRFQFDLEGEKPFNIATVDGKLKFDVGKIEGPSATFVTDVRTFYSVFSGEISQDEAFLTRKIDVNGSIMASARFKRMSTLLLQSHRTSLRILRVLIRVVPL